MDESLTEQCRVRDEGLRVVNRCQWGGNFDRTAQSRAAPAVLLQFGSEL